MVSQQARDDGRGGYQGVSRLPSTVRSRRAARLQRAWGVPASSGYLLAPSDSETEGSPDVAAGSRARRSTAESLLRLCTAVSACALRAATLFASCTVVCDWPARPGSRNLMPGLRPCRMRGPWRGKGYTSSHAASGLETLAIAETEECATSLSLYLVHSTLSPSRQSC